MIAFEVKAESAFAQIQGAPQQVLDRFEKNLEPIERAMLADAKARAAAHIHSLGAKPGRYLDSFGGGVKQEHGSVVGWVGNSSPLAHLLEKGFTISDLMIYAKGGAMKFAVAGVGDLYRKAVHRRATLVKPYPAILPAFEAKKPAIEAAAAKAVSGV